MGMFMSDSQPPNEASASNLATPNFNQVASPATYSRTFVTVHGMGEQRKNGTLLAVLNVLHAARQ